MSNRHTILHRCSPPLSRKSASSVMLSYRRRPDNIHAHCFAQHHFGRTALHTQALPLPALCPQSVYTLPVPIVARPLSTCRGSSPLKSVHPGRLNSGFRAVCASWVQGTRRLAFSPHLYIVYSTFAFFSRFLLIERRISRKIKPGVSLTSATLSAHSSPTVTQVVCASKTAA